MEDDICWLHVSIRGGEIALFDLGSLEECDDASVDVAGEQLGNLEKREEYP